MNDSVKYLLFAALWGSWFTWRGHRAYQRGEDWSWLFSVAGPSFIGFCIGNIVYELFLKGVF